METTEGGPVRLLLILLVLVACRNTVRSNYPPPTDTHAWGLAERARSSSRCANINNTMRRRGLLSGVVGQFVATRCRHGSVALTDAHDKSTAAAAHLSRAKLWTQRSMD